MTQPLYITEAEVARLVTVKDAIAALEEMFASWGDPLMQNLPRQRAKLPTGAFNHMGASYGAKNIYGLKAYAGGKGSTQGHVLIYSNDDFSLKAMIECDLLGQTRTGAASGLATKLMANPDARTLGVIGTGRQSRAQVMAVCAVRPIERVQVFVRTAASREAYAREMEKTLGIEVRPVATAEACVGEADVVVTITKSAEPVFRADWLAKGAHVNVAGANSGRPARGRRRNGVARRREGDRPDRAGQGRGGRIPRSGGGRQARLDRCPRTGRHRHAARPRAEFRRPT